MSDLEKLQNTFIDDCLSGKLKEGEVRMEPYLDSSVLSAKAQMEIYQDSALGNINHAMKQTYDVLERLVGERFFAHIIDNFVLEYRPTSGDMADFGEELPEFLKNFKPAQDHPYLSDVAKLEWLFKESANADREQIIDATSFSNVPAERYMDLKFTVHVSVNIMQSKYPVLHIWQSNKDNDGIEEIDLDEGGDTLLMVCPQNKVNIHRIIKAEKIFIENLQKGHTLFEAFEYSVGEDESFDMQESLNRFLSYGVFSSVFLQS